METQKIELDNILSAIEENVHYREGQEELRCGVRKAYSFAENSHQGQFRADGKTPYITHPVAVACRLATEFEKYSETFRSYKLLESYAAFVQAGLLHDVVEDCGVSLEEIADKFGSEASFLVDGMTKVMTEKNGELHADKDATLRKIAAYGFKDPRLFLIKLCDVAHNSSGIANLAKAKQERFAKYGIEFYAPLAERLGFEKLAEEIRQYSSKYYQGDGKETLFKYFEIGELGNLHNIFNAWRN